jgi:endo-1,4-beta-xylanase
MFSFLQLRDVLVWGLCDRHSWLQDFKPLRTDGIAKRPCAYDADYRAKPLRTAIAEALRNAPAR